MFGEWVEQRRKRRISQAAVRQQLHEEYLERVEASDADALEAARDFGDNDSVSWRVEVGQGLAFLAVLGLVAVVAVLIVFFMWIKHLTAG